jgi:hypothetical protein
MAEVHGVNGARVASTCPCLTLCPWPTVRAEVEYETQPGAFIMDDLNTPFRALAGEQSEGPCCSGQ